MAHIPLKSSSIRSIDWRPPDTLEIIFASGHIHRFEGISHLEYARFLAAPSKGAYFHQHIRGKYRGQPVGKIKK